MSAQLVVTRAKLRSLHVYLTACALYSLTHCLACARSCGNPRLTQVSSVHRPE
jgi:hypothetical protein